jgi:hypothetical protein
MYADMLKQRWVSQEETVLMLDRVCLHHLVGASSGFG